MRFVPNLQRHIGQRSLKNGRQLCIVHYALPLTDIFVYIDENW